MVHENDMRPPCPVRKHVDDGTLFETCAPNSTSALQDSRERNFKWTRENRMKNNTSKMKAMMTCFCKEPAKLTENAHVDHIVSKANKRLYILYQLKRAGTAQHDITSTCMNLCISHDKLWNTHVRFGMRVYLVTSPRTYWSKGPDPVKCVYPSQSYSANF